MAVLNYNHRNLQDREIHSFLADTVTQDLQQFAEDTDVFVDLSFNRFTEAGLQEVAKFLEAWPKVTACVGYNHFQFSGFYKTLADMGHTRWVAEGRIVMERTAPGEQLKKLAALEEFAQQLLEVSVKQHEVSAKRLKMLEDRDPTAQLRQMKNYRDADDRLIEQGVTSAVAGLLDDASIVHASRYEYQDAIGDLDGLVTGKLNNEDVAVLCEAKHNMNSNISKAKKELFASAEYWDKLCQLDPTQPDVGEATLADYNELKIAENRSRKVMLAFGGMLFSLDVAEKQLGRLMKPWFFVVPSPSGRFVATHHPGLAASPQAA